MNRARIANHIKELREAQGLSVRDLSERSGLSVGFISNLENETADRGDATIRSLEHLAHALGVDLHALIERHEHAGTDYKKNYGE